MNHRRVNPVGMAGGGDPLKFLRDADWLDNQGARIYRAMLATIIGLAMVGWLLLSRHGLDPVGKPLGTDFLSFYTASGLALGGHPTAPYDVATHNAAQMALFNAGQGYAAFFYPPPYLLLCLPLGLLPYLPSLLLWLGTSLAAYALVIHRLLDRWQGSGLSLIAFPAVMLNMGHGQNAFITAALMGGGLLLLDRKPWTAGALMGCLVIKPHLALLIPIVLAARREWRAFLGASASATALMALSLAAFGAGTWHAFFANATLARQTLEAGLVDPAKLVSTFAAVRVLHGPVWLAYALQAIISFGVVATLIAMARARLPARVQNAALAAGAVIATPFVLDYDLAWTALPLAWLFTEGRRSGFLPWEKLAMAAAFLLPLFARTVAMHLHAPIAPAVLAGLFWVTARRGFLSARAPAAFHPDASCLRAPAAGPRLASG